MEGLSKFMSEFLGQFFGGLWGVLTGIAQGLAKMFNIPAYIDVFKSNSGEMGAGAWVLGILAALLVLLAMAAIVVVLVMITRRYLRVRKTLVSQEELLNEVGRLNGEVVKLMTEKDRILSMKVSQLGLQPGESAIEDEEAGKTVAEGETRFYKLTRVDEQMLEYVPPECDNQITLEQICDRFRNFACSRMGLFYEIKVIRLFLAAFSCTRLVILQGISGTGKTSLPYSFSKFLQNDAQIASVQPSWRDRTELFGYFNEFTKRFNETETLRTMYEATYKNDIYLTILDEMNIARVEYYFAEMLSILEMPSREEWMVDLVPSAWDSDPKHVENGRFRLPENMWYIGTANNDDSTFAISDKVYDRAMPINIDTKGIYFEAPQTDPVRIDYHHVEQMFEQAKAEHRVSDSTVEKINQLDDYVIKHFRLAFGNRIVKQLRDFVPAYVACGGTEIEGVDYVLANKIFRKFESLNLAFVRDEIDGLVTYLEEQFGKNNMNDSIAYLRRLQKLF